VTLVSPVEASAADDATSSARVGRKRKRDESAWCANVRKTKRSQGEEYFSKPVKGSVPRKREKRKIIIHRCGQCVNRCNERMPVSMREKLFHAYWGMADQQRQRDFICSHVEKKIKKRNRSEADSKRKNTLYYFLNDTDNGTRIKVCKATFLSTLGIGERLVMYSMKNILETGMSQPDQRGRRPPGIKKPESVREDVRSHIKSFPALPSHYARAKTTKTYLEANLNVQKMYRLYCELCVSKQTEPVKESFYRDIFDHEFNIAFHVPKKDACNYCCMYTNSSAEQKDELNVEYLAHMQRKIDARVSKQANKELAQSRADTVTVTFDLEAVLLSPKLNVSSLYYKRKLSTYNCTVYNLGNHDVVCYMWHEAAGGRGSCEIATSILCYINSLPDTIRHLILYSDTCSGQNRNQNISAMFLYAVQKTNVELIDHFYMESGHSQMECDSAHSTIEKMVKKTDIYTPMDYYHAVRLARKSKPFTVKILDTTEFLDFKQVANKIVRNRTIAIDGSKLNWLKVKQFRYAREKPFTVQFKYGYKDVDPFLELQVNRSARGRRPDTMPESIRSLFSQPPPISDAKFKDLISLCNSQAIPRDYHSFYQSLSHSSASRDVLTEPDACDDIEQDPSSIL
jgi:hypothetical protein